MRGVKVRWRSLAKEETPADADVIPGAAPAAQNGLPALDAPGERDVDDEAVLGQRRGLSSGHGDAVLLRELGHAAVEPFGVLNAARGVDEQGDKRVVGQPTHGGDVGERAGERLAPDEFGRSVSREVDSLNDNVRLEQQILVLIPAGDGTVIAGADDEALISGQASQQKAQRGIFTPVGESGAFREGRIPGGRFARAADRGVRGGWGGCNVSEGGVFHHQVSSRVKLMALKVTCSAMGMMRLRLR